MKKFLVAILAMLYMASAMGATMHIHYCMGKPAGMNFTHKDEERCRKCGMKKTEGRKGCCKDEYKTIKTNDHKLSIAAFDFSYNEVVLQEKPGYIFQQETSIFGFSTNNIRHIPPLIKRSCPIYIRFRNFRI